MISLRNIFRKTSPSIIRLSIALRAFIGTISAAAYVQEKSDLAFWLLVAGAAIDFILQLLPEDTKVKDSTRNFVLIVGLVASGVMLSGCKVLRPATNTSLIDSVNTTYKPVDVSVKGAKVQDAINIDSLLNVWLSKLKKYQADSAAAAQRGLPIPAKPQLPKQSVTDPQSKAQLTYWLDQYGKLQVSCVSKDQTIQMLVAETNRLRSEKAIKTEVIKETPTMNYIIIAVLATLLSISIIINLITFKR